MSARVPTGSGLAPSDDHEPCVTRGAVRDVVRAAVEDHIELLFEAATRPALLTTKQLARELQCSERTVTNLRAEGLPTLMVGDSPRYEWPAVLAWLKTRGEP
jgi:hypothetical protein